MHNRPEASAEVLSAEVKFWALEFRKPHSPHSSQLRAGGLEKPRAGPHHRSSIRRLRKRRGAPLSDPAPAQPQAVPITLYSSAICPYCMAAKNFLKSKGLTWSEVRIDLDPSERERMIARAKRTSVPQIFVGDVHVGGFDDMMALHRAGKFEPLLVGEGG
jgi:glutaredoxin 3